jgi:putative transposase
MSTYTQILYHIVFATKNRRRVLDQPRREDLFRYVWGIVKNHDCHLYRIGGVEDHVHILSSLHSTVALADLIKDIKVASSGWIKDERVFPEFDAWQEGYAALTYSLADKDRLIEYIKGQEEHHRTVSFLDEYREMLRAAGIELDERYLP